MGLVKGNPVETDRMGKRLCRMAKPGPGIVEQDRFEVGGAVIWRRRMTKASPLLPLENVARDHPACRYGYCCKGGRGNRRHLAVGRRRWWTRSLPVEKALDDCLAALKMKARLRAPKTAIHCGWLSRVGKATCGSKSSGGRSLAITRGNSVKRPANAPTGWPMAGRANSFGGWMPSRLLRTPARNRRSLMVPVRWYWPELACFTNLRTVAG